MSSHGVQNLAIQSRQPDFTHKHTKKTRKSQNFKKDLSFGETDSRVCPTNILRLYSISTKKSLKKSRMMPKRTIMVDNLSETVRETSDRKSDFCSIFSDPNYVYSLSFIVKLHL